MSPFSLFTASVLSAFLNSVPLRYLSATSSRGFGPSMSERAGAPERTSARELVMGGGRWIGAHKTDERGSAQDEAGSPAATLPDELRGGGPGGAARC